MEIYRG